MGEAIGEVLPAAIGVALSPMPVVAVILMLFSPRARTNGPAFLAGWLIGIVVALALAVLLASPNQAAGGAGEPATLSSLIRLVLGVALLFLAWRDWHGHPKPGEPAALPTWMARLDQATPIVALGLGADLSVCNPKNLIFNVAAGLAIAQADLPVSAALVSAVVYILLASVSAPLQCVGA